MPASTCPDRSAYQPRSVSNMTTRANVASDPQAGCSISASITVRALRRLSSAAAGCPPAMQAARQPKERHSSVRRSQDPSGAPSRQRLNARQQPGEAGVGSTDLASLELVFTQPAFAQIFRSCEPSTFLRPLRGHCLTYAPPVEETLGNSPKRSRNLAMLLAISVAASRSPASRTQFQCAPQVGQFFLHKRAHLLRVAVCLHRIGSCQRHSSAARSVRARPGHLIFASRAGTVPAPGGNAGTGQ